MKGLSDRQLAVLRLLDANEWRPLERTDAIVAGFLCKPVRPGGKCYVERQPDLSRSGSAQMYRLTKDGAWRMRFEMER